MSNTVFVIANDGTRLMPTNYKRARSLLKKNDAVIYKHQPFTIKLTRDSEHNVQPVEFKEDTGDRYIGVSLCSEVREYVSAEYKLPNNETEHHNDQRKYRRTRRNRKRYRKPQFDNRRIPEGWLAPSVAHKKDAHIRIFEMYNEVCPITRAVFEVGSFDTHALREYEENGAVISGTDYQRGERYGFETLKLAVLYKQNYKCPVCGKSLIGCRSAIHHIGYRKGDRSNRLANLAALHDYEHTSANHQPGGVLYDLKPGTKNFASAAFMNTVRWYIVNEAKSRFPDVEIIHTYGAETAMRRKDLGIKKSHANDAFTMGIFHPERRANTLFFEKRRRNNRILCKFYDAKYIDIRTGKPAKGSALGCNRTNRSISRNNPSNMRTYHGTKLSAGRISTRTRRYSINNGDVVLLGKTKLTANGTSHYGEYVHFGKGIKDVKTNRLRILRYARGWVQV